MLQVLSLVALACLNRQSVLVPMELQEKSSGVLLSLFPIVVISSNSYCFEINNLN